MKTKAILGFLACSITATSAFASGLTPAWATSSVGTTYKLVPYPHACNLTSQSATTDLYGYTLPYNGGTASGVRVDDYDPTTGASSWSQTVNSVNYFATMLPGDMDAYGTTSGGTDGAAVLVRETAPGGADFLHLVIATSSGVVDVNNSAQTTFALGGANVTKPLFVKMDDTYIYTVVQPVGQAPIIAAWDKAGGLKGSTQMSSVYTITSAYLQRKDELSGLSASYMLLAEYNGSGVGICKVTYSSGTVALNLSSPQEKPSPPGITVTGLSAQTSTSGPLQPLTCGIDSTGTYAYLIGTSSYTVTYLGLSFPRTWGFNLAYTVSGTTPSYYTWVGVVSDNNYTYESAGGAVSTEKCNGTFAGYNIWADNTTYFNGVGSAYITGFTWYPAAGGTASGVQNAEPYNVQQCASFYDSGLGTSVAWYAGARPDYANAGGVVKYTSSTSNPLGGTPTSFTMDGYGQLLDMEEGGTGEVYVSMPGVNPTTGTNPNAPVNLYRFN